MSSRAALCAQVTALINKPELSYAEILRMANRTTRNIALLFLAVIGAVLGFR